MVVMVAAAATTMSSSSLALADREYDFPLQQLAPVGDSQDGDVTSSSGESRERRHLTELLLMHRDPTYEDADTGEETEEEEEEMTLEETEAAAAEKICLDLDCLVRKEAWRHGMTGGGGGGGDISAFV